MNRFVVLLHRSDGGVFCEEHWDIMLEVYVDGCGQLDTWSIPPQICLLEIKNANLNKLNSFSCPAKKLPYHRLAYLDYEGEISNNRGNVQKIDNGTYQKISNNKFKLSGNLLDGELTITDTPDSCEIIFVP
ncbi:MAG: hypothetical protein LBJ00_03200 [Planctomycetaceae bacterium]|jgi:hypothetical protein|nr:hypothetical protein [Planctomycetaceae bacterium]